MKEVSFNQICANCRHYKRKSMGYTSRCRYRANEVLTVSVVTGEKILRGDEDCDDARSAHGHCNFAAIHFEKRPTLIDRFKSIWEKLLKRKT
jgi:hypothetical protein